VDVASSGPDELLTAEPVHVPGGTLHRASYQEGTDGRSMWHVRERGEAHSAFGKGENLRETDHLEDLGVDGRIILKWPFKNRMWDVD
jgi:hypothetical protein